MTLGNRPARWRSADQAIRAVQVAFDVEEAVLNAIRRTAFESQLSNSDQIRVVLGLPVVRQRQRIRLTVSLTEADYQLLGARYGIEPADRLGIKERVTQALIDFTKASRKTARAKRATRP